MFARKQQAPQPLSSAPYRRLVVRRPTVMISFSLWLLIAVLIAFEVLSSSAAWAQPQAPTADSSYRVPIAINTQSGVVVFDGNGQAFVIGRADEGPLKSSLVVQRVRDGACVLCGFPEAYGTPFVVDEGGYYTISAVDANDKRVVRVYRLDEGEGFAKRPALGRAAVLPLVAR